MTIELLAAFAGVLLLVAGVCFRPIEAALRVLRDRQRKARRKKRHAR